MHREVKFTSFELTEPDGGNRYWTEGPKQVD